MGKNRDNDVVVSPKGVRLAAASLAGKSGRVIVSLVNDV
jgi:hypothetical protein